MRKLINCVQYDIYYANYHVKGILGTVTKWKWKYFSCSWSAKTKLKRAKVDKNNHRCNLSTYLRKHDVIIFLQLLTL